jgi:6-pyruvoyltetrahydropterin/6-carboxytetrahydropterin synthase
MGTSRARRYTQWILDALLIVLMVGSLAVVGLARLVPATGHPVFIVDSNPTVERIARLIFDHAKSQNFGVVRVKVWETPTSFAEYSEG